MHHLPRAAALAACALLTLSACSGSGSSDAPSAAGKDGKNSTSSGSPSSKATPSRSAAAGEATGGTGPAQAVTSKAEVSIKSCQLRDASKLFAVIQLNNTKGAADYAYTVKVRFLNPAHPGQAVYTTLAHQPVPVGVMRSALASTAWKGNTAAMPKTCEVAKATKVKTAS
ncbi:hypothetical protein [Streptomyces sp. Rer75]|uniref:hypothetical protein n=1 Tax=unclassified Streptomyces TaxID=2593676 RepID=UPI0015D08888|nr:hypothetical protein [Streptomyces sp. Rer75]QLH19546.1 hypothetical protein HYQ63_01870 [Streptomyces sp. Rer75]